jgi:hypothetical protein
MNEDFNDGVKIAIARMESNPEEFFEPTPDGKWSWLYKAEVREVLTEEEKVAVHSALKKVRRLEITHRAMKAVLPELEESLDPQLLQPPIGKDGRYKYGITHLNKTGTLSGTGAHLAQQAEAWRKAGGHK